ncbi:hypothetical protein BC629DRAFT_68749 [Irpex lacteus]|nr:hypothetical protein BC629DRAFT_68749 [Irpex lacteus]
MSSIFANFKRKSRSRTKPEHVSPSKAKPLDILPGVREIEEEDPRLSTSSILSTSTSSSTNYLSPTYRANHSAGHPFGTSSRSSTFQDAAERKRDSRRVVLTGAEGLTFEDFFPVSAAPPRPAPSPPQATTSLPPLRRPIAEDPYAVIESPLDSINVRFSGLHLQFDVPTTPSTVRSPSPTPSVASSRTTSTTASSSSTASTVSTLAPATPPTSDDESHAKPHPYSNLNRAPTHKSQRASVHYVKSASDMRWPSRKRESMVPPIPMREEDDDSDSDDVSWFAQELSDIIIMAPTAPEPQLRETRRARPDSVLLLPHPTASRSKRNGLSHLSIQVPSMPSSQLDPTFPQRQRQAMPSRAPPPPPIVIESPPSPTMEEKTEELLAMLANAAMDLNFLGTGLTGSSSMLPPSVPVTPSSAFAIVSPQPLRPPPRSAIPADIDYFDDTRTPETRDALSDERDGELEFEIDNLPSPEWPPTPKSTSLYSQASISLDTIPVELATPKTSKGSFDRETPVSPAFPDSPFVGTSIPFFMESSFQPRLVAVP